MKKKLFENFNREFNALCVHPDSDLQYDYLCVVISFLFGSGVITGSEYRFLNRAIQIVHFGF